jgi:hypothetical protein
VSPASTSSPSPSLSPSVAPTVLSRRQTTEFWKNLMQTARVDISFSTRLLGAGPNPSNGAAELWQQLQQADKWKKKRGKAPPLLQCLQQPKSEADVQRVMNWVHDYCTPAASAIVVRDTSDGSCAPLQPQHKFDHCGVPRPGATNAAPARVSWYDVVWVEQLKKSMGDTPLLDEARLQLSDDLLQMFTKQPERAFAMGFISDGLRIQFFHLEQPRDRAARVSVISTGMLPFLDLSSLSPTDGFVLYAALPRCHPS